jgi:hypothetical protein
MLAEAILSIVIGLTIPKLFVVLFLKKQQRVMMYYMFWGFFSAIIMYYIFDFINGSTVIISYQEITITPLLEEFIKGFPLIALFLVTGRKFEKHILPFAMSCGIGFSILGNYIFTMIGGDFTQINLVLYAILRAGGTSLMQGCCTAIIGYGIYLIKDMDKKALPALLLGLYAVSVIVHAIYNLLVFYSDTGKYFGILISFLLLVSLLLLYYQDQLPKLDDLSGLLLAE